MKRVTQKVCVIVDGKTVAIEPSDHPTGAACVFDVPTSIDEALDMFGEGKILDFIERQHTQDIANKYRVEFKETRDNPLKAERLAIVAEMKSLKGTTDPAKQARLVEISMRLAEIGIK